PFGITYSLLIVSPVINDIAVRLLITLLVWQVAVLYVLAGMAFAYAGGMIMERSCRSLGRGLRVKDPHGRG
ncbi:MAG: hypothetical protein ACNA75_07785, partial [Thiohalomonadaceae bacterium]